MASEASNLTPDLDQLAPLDIIFNCNICHASIRDIYSNVEDNQGFRDGRHPSENAVNKFWMTQCGHLICSKHFEGGGALTRQYPIDLKCLMALSLISCAFSR